MDESSALADINVKACVEALVERIYMQQSTAVSVAAKQEEGLKLTFQEIPHDEPRCCV